MSSRRQPGSSRSVSASSAWNSRSSDHDRYHKIASGVPSNSMAEIASLTQRRKRGRVAVGPDVVMIARAALSLLLFVGPLQQTIKDLDVNRVDRPKVGADGFDLV